MKGVFFALPAFDGRHYSATCVSVAFTSAMLSAQGHSVLFGTLSIPDIVQLRNLLLTVWYDKTDLDHLLFIDGDMEFSPQMVEAMVELNEPVVGCIYPKKTYPIRFVFNGNLMPDKRITHPYDHRFLQVEGIGFGVTLIKREAIKQMIESGLPYQDQYLERGSFAGIVKDFGLTRILRPFDLIALNNGHTLSEDISFCQRWTQLGNKIWAAADWEIGHIGPHAYRGNFIGFGRVPKEHEQKEMTA